MDVSMEQAREIADEAVDCFSRLHPHLRMNITERADLKEMIEREVRGTLADDGLVSARDLLE